MGEAFPLLDLDIDFCGFKLDLKILWCDLISMKSVGEIEQLYILLIKTMFEYITNNDKGDLTIVPYVKS